MTTGGTWFNAADDLRDAVDRGDGTASVGLNGLDRAGDVLGRLGGLLRQFLTSEATTAKPLPISPARAGSIVAFSASEFVYSAIWVITLMTLPISVEDSPSLPMVAEVVAVTPTASASTRASSLAFCDIS
jgi:hypothetical protein